MMSEPTIVEALAMWSDWNCEISPLGPTGDYVLDVRLADAFRMLLYRPDLTERLNWLEREARRPVLVRPRDHRYRCELLSWWLEIWHAEKVPVIEARNRERRALQLA